TCSAVTCRWLTLSVLQVAVGGHAHRDSDSQLSVASGLPPTLVPLSYTGTEDENPPDAQVKLAKYLGEFATYIRANAHLIPNYGERHRCGEAISSALAESTVNQVISKRMVKKQQMRWSPTGAQLCLQVRTAVLNNDLAGCFHRWYPGFTH